MSASIGASSSILPISESRRSSRAASIRATAGSTSTRSSWRRTARSPRGSAPESKLVSRSLTFEPSSLGRFRVFWDGRALRHGISRFEPDSIAESLENGRRPRETSVTDSDSGSTRSARGSSSTGATSTPSWRSLATGPLDRGRLLDDAFAVGGTSARRLRAREEYRSENDPRRADLNARCDQVLHRAQRRRRPRGRRREAAPVRGVLPLRRDAPPPRRQDPGRRA